MKKFIKLSAALILVFSSASWAILPPQYLRVHDWKSCVGQMTRGSAQFYCLPVTKPIGCPLASWKTLTRNHMLSLCR